MQFLKLLAPWRIKRAIQFWFQRRTRGWDDSETWDLYTTLARMIAPRLKRFRELREGLNNGCPCSLIEDFDSDESVDSGVAKWEDMLAKMQRAFQLVADDKCEYTKEEQAEIDEGLKLFAEHFESLWS